MLAYLLTLVEESQRAAFTKLYLGHRRLVWTVTGWYFHAEDRRKDAFQQAWLRVIQAFEKISAIPAALLPGYLVVVAKNECKTLLAQERRYWGDRGPEDWSELDRLPADPAQEPEARAEWQDTDRRVMELIAALPEPYCAVLEMRLVLERSNREVAQALHITEAKASTWFTRGKARLVKRLKEEGLGLE